MNKASKHTFGDMAIHGVDDNRNFGRGHFSGQCWCGNSGIGGWGVGLFSCRGSFCIVGLFPVSDGLRFLFLICISKIVLLLFTGKTHGKKWTRGVGVVLCVMGAGTKVLLISC